MNTETLINATSIKAVNVRKVKTLLNHYLMHSEGIEESNKELAETQRRQSMTKQDFGDEMELIKCHRAIDLAQLRRVKIELSNYGILIDES